MADMEDVHRVVLYVEQDSVDVRPNGRKEAVSPRTETARFPEPSYIARENARGTGWPVPN